MNKQAYELWLAIEAKCRELNPHIEITKAAIEGEHQLLLEEAALRAEHSLTGSESLSPEGHRRLSELFRNVGKVEGTFAAVTAILGVLEQHNCRSFLSDDPES